MHKAFSFVGAFGFVVLAAMLFRVESKPREPYVGEVIGNIRVQILSPTLVRIELKGPRGFEDRNTFTVQKRPRPIAPEKTEVDGHLHRIFYGSIEVAVNGGQSIADVIVYRDGKLAFKGTAKPQQLAFFPSPGHIPKSLPVYDAPRIIPSKWGAVPAKSKVKGETSGWDLSNQSTDVYVFLPDNYSQFRKEFLSLTGPTELPPLYSFGFWHSRYHPYSDKEALDVIDTYRKKDIPLDVFVVDTDWRVGASHGYATNAKLFPDMPGFIAKAHAKNVRLMYNDHPEPVGKTALEPKELAYRYEGLSSLLNMGVDVWWYDRNWSTHLHEPAPGLPKEVWGAAMFHDITQTARPNQRPLIMSNVPGIDNGLRNSVPHAAAHRYPVWWTGDTTGSFQYLENGIVNAVNSGADTFIPYLSEDLGGHFGNPLREVYSRFVQYGSLSPLARLHCTAGETRDPWAFGEPAESIVRDYVKLRYRLLPTFYAAARENYENGTPLLRRCDLDWPGMDGASAADQYLLGDDILVAPIFTSVDPEPTAIPVELLHNSSGGTGLKGEYFPNVDLKGAPQLVRMDPQIDFNWKVGPPAPGMPDENFSIRWTGKVGPVPVSGSYEFVTVTDDGVRLWVDGKMIIDKFQNMDHWQNRGSIDLEAGRSYDIRMDYFDSGNEAAAHLSWVTPDRPRTNQATRSVWVPPGQWIDLWTGDTIAGPKKMEVHAGIRQTPMWIREGSVSILAPEMDYTGQRTWDRLTIEAYPPAGGSVARTLYEDDGITNGYKKGQFAKTDVRLTRSGKVVNLRIGPAKGRYDGKLDERSWIARFHLPEGTSVASATIEGRNVDARVIAAEASENRMPLLGKGPDARGVVVEIEVPKASTSKAQTIQIGLG